MAAYALVAAAFASACSSASSALSVFAAGKNGAASTAVAPTNAPPPPASAGTTRPDRALMAQSKTRGGDLAGKPPTTFSKGDGGNSAPKGDGGASAPKGDGGGAPEPSGGGASTSGGGGFTFSVPKVLALLNQRRAKEGLPPFAIDTALMNGAQRRANAGEFPHTLDWYLATGACENLSIECAGSGDQAVEWAIFKLFDFERDNKTNATAPGSPCYAVIPTDQGHYRNFTNKVATCSSNKLGIGVAPLKKFNGGAPPSHMTTLVVFWIR